MISKSFLKSIGSDDTGATAVEYGLIAALIVVVMLVGLSVLASTNSDIWTMIKEQSVEAMTR